MNKNKLIELRCKAWGITEDEYYCNQCSDFSLEDMARAYRRGKNKGRADLEKKRAESQGITNKLHQLTKAKEIIMGLLTHNLKMPNYVIYNLDEDVIKQAESYLSSSERPNK